jgi:hypothetical protein
MKTYSLEELTDKHIGKKEQKKGMNSRTNFVLTYWAMPLNRQGRSGI